MLTSELARVDYKGGRVIPDRLTRGRHAHYVDLAARILRVYRSGAGRTRHALHRAATAILEEAPDCDDRRAAALCKLLDDAGEFETDAAGRAAALRLQVFGAAAVLHPLVESTDRLFEQTEHIVKNRIAHALGRPWDEIDRDLYADVIDQQRLKAFQGYPSPEALLARYNVAQVQACLYRAERLSLRVTGGFQQILRHIKLAGLLHEIERLGPSEYRIDLSGPASAMRRSRRYGVAMARFLPALLSNRGWSLEAVVQTPWKSRARLELSDRDGLHGHRDAAPEFDSRVEEAFARRFGPERAGWRLLRGAVILHEGQTTFVPDFVFRHEDGTEVLLEIVGFWTPEYLARKRERLARFARHRILIAIPAASLKPGRSSRGGMIVYKTRIKAAPVLAALEAQRGRRLRGAVAAGGS